MKKRRRKFVLGAISRGTLRDFVKRIFLERRKEEDHQAGEDIPLEGVDLQSGDPLQGDDLFRLEGGDMLDFDNPREGQKARGEEIIVAVDIRIDIPVVILIATVQIAGGNVGRVAGIGELALEGSIEDQSLMRGVMCMH